MLNIVLGTKNGKILCDTVFSGKELGAITRELADDGKGWRKPWDYSLIT